MKPKQPDVAFYYRKMQIETSSRQKQLTMLHEKCLEFIKVAEADIGLKRRLRLERAQNILTQLQAALRIEDSLSQGLFYIYDYLYVLLERGNNDDCQKAREVIAVICDTFRQLLVKY